MKSTTFVVVALLVLSCLPAVAAETTEGPPPAPVAVSSADEQLMSPQIWVPGTVVSRHQARIAAEVSGQLVWVADIGDFVAEGEPLARIDDQALQLQLKTDDATIKRLESNLEYLRQQVDRLERLTEQQVVAPTELDEVVSRLRSAEQEIVSAEVGRERTLYQLEQTEVKAPFSGRVVERVLQPGSYATTGSEVVNLVDTKRVEVRAQAPLTVAPFVREGLSVVVDDKARQSEASIRRVVSVGDERSRMFELRVALDGDDWMIGSPVKVALPSDQPREVVTVPRDALILRADATYVFKVIGDGTVERISVSTGSGTSSLIAVEGAVEAGDQIVVRGGERLRPGQAVSVDGGDTPAGP